jgi:Tol biopolymer transport system component
LYYGRLIGQPSWSPDGSRILFSDGTTRQAYVVDVDGRNVREVLDSADQPVWSPDGQRLAYVVLDANGQSAALAVARADGTDEQRLTDGKVLSLAWSPDGSTIAFVRDRGTSSELDLINPDGTGERTIATGGGPGGFGPPPVWSPSGDEIAYVKGEDVAVVSPGGTNERIVKAGLPGASVGALSWRAAAPLPSHRRPCVVTGTPGADVLRGKNRGDVLFGGAGNDKIYGAGGEDVLIGGSGQDRLFGGSGNDFLKTKDAKGDYLFGGPGRDVGSYDLYRDHVKSVERYDAE